MRRRRHPAETEAKDQRLPRRRRPLLRWALALGLVGGAVLFGAGLLIDRAATGRIAHAPDQVTARRVALVLGCAPRLRSGQPNPFFEHRLGAAAELLRRGKVEYLLLSGDNHRRGYDEPSAMKERLVALGAPANRLVLDYAGFSTFDSVVRARQVFGLTNALVVSQADHAARAVYLGDRTGLHLDAYAAPDVRLEIAWRTRLREALARVRAVLDVSVFGRRPHFLGPPVPIGPDRRSA